MAELARSTRSGIIESVHHGDAAVVTAEGAILATWGDPARRSFFRSAIKPFQATISQEEGAALVPEQMAIACASHEAHAVQIALVRDMLETAGLSENDLQTPAGLPSVRESVIALAAAGRGRPRRIFHNCSGKHAAFLRACVARDWPTRTYLDAAHPLQRLVVELVEEVTGEPADPLGVDGCGAPAPSGTVLGLARAFARLTVDDRFADAVTAMTRYPALTSSPFKEDGRISAAWGGPVKRGAKGMIAAGRNGIGIAVKSREGSTSMAAVGLIGILRRMGLISDAARDAIRDVASPATYGGGRRVGSVEPSLDA